MSTTAARHSSESNEHYTPTNIVEAARSLLVGIDLDPASSAAAQERVLAMHWYGLDHPSYERNNGLLAPWWHYPTHGNYTETPSRAFINPPGGRCDKFGRTVIIANKAKDIKPCTESGACGLPPGHKHEGVQSSQKAWWQKLVAEYAADRVRSAIFVRFSVELLQTAQVNQIGWLPLDFPICFPERRIAYVKPDGSVGKSPPHSSCIIYLPPKHHSQAEALQDFRAAFGWLGAIK